MSKAITDLTPETGEEECRDPEPVTVTIEMKVEYRISVLPSS